MPTSAIEHSTARLPERLTLAQAVAWIAWRDHTQPLEIPPGETAFFRRWECEPSATEPAESFPPFRLLAARVVGEPIADHDPTGQWPPLIDEILSREGRGAGEVAREMLDDARALQAERQQRRSAIEAAARDLVSAMRSKPIGVLGREILKGALHDRQPRKAMAIRSIPREQLVALMAVDTGMIARGIIALDDGIEDGVPRRRLFRDVTVSTSDVLQLWPAAEGHATAPKAAPAGRAVREKHRGGRPSEYDWEEFAGEMIRIANRPDGLPEDKRKLTRHMRDWCKRKWGRTPAPSAIRDRINRLLS